MAGPKLKQYLENSWYRGASQDRQTGYAAQYQYAEGVNTRDMRNGVCLAGGRITERTTASAFIYFQYNKKIYAFTESGKVIDVDSGAEKCTVSFTGDVDRIFAEPFGDYIYVYIGGKFAQLDPSSTTWGVTDYSNDVSRVDCMLNYANTYLLIGDSNELYRMDETLGTPTFDVIRDFKSGYTIYGLTQEGNYLKIYTSDGENTKIHYAKGTFDVEDTGLVQTVTLKGMSISRGCVTSDQGNDYVLFKVGDDFKLSKIQGYNKIDIRWTNEYQLNEVFGGRKKGTHKQHIVACDGVLFASMYEGVRTFTEYNGWLRGGCVEFPRERSNVGTEFITSMFRFGERLYTCTGNSDLSSFDMGYFDMSFHPSKYQHSGFIIGRVFDGGCAGLFKKNDQATITYNMPEGTSMELSYRYDRSSFGYYKSNFLPIKTLTDTTNCYDIVVPTTPGTNAGSVLLMENDTDEILLENGNGIELEELMVCPFNKTWNLLEYRFDFTSNTGLVSDIFTPTLYEHSLTYYDYMRKYR